MLWPGQQFDYSAATAGQIWSKGDHIKQVNGK